jgi:hypothetical protein
VSVRIAWDPESDVAVLFDSVSGFPIHTRVFDAPESYEDAERFLAYLGDRDPRLMGPSALERWRKQFEEVTAARG